MFLYCFYVVGYLLFCGIVFMQTDNARCSVCSVNCDKTISSRVGPGEWRIEMAERVTIQKEQEWVNGIYVKDIDIQKEYDKEKKTFKRYDEKGNDVTGQTGPDGKPLGKTKIRTFNYDVPVTKKDENGKAVRGEDGKPVYEMGADGKPVTKPVKDRITITLVAGDKDNQYNGQITAVVPRGNLFELDPDTAKKRSAYRKSHDIPYRKEWNLRLPEGKAIPIQHRVVEGKEVKIVYGNTNAQNIKMALSEKAHVNQFSYTPNGNEKVLIDKDGKKVSKDNEAAMEVAQEVKPRGKSKGKGME